MDSVWLCCLIVLGFSYALASEYVTEDGGQPYCSTGNSGGKLCCTGRKDNCSLPRLPHGPWQTLCYCDIFCTRTNRIYSLNDCCPDYENVCLGKPIPTPVIKRECFYEGKFYPANTAFKDNCKKCECKDFRDQMKVLCSMDDCMVNVDLIHTINSQRYRGWRAGNVTNFWGRSIEEGYNGMLGTNYSNRKIRTMNAIDSYARKDRLNRHFDFRNTGYVSPIKDQGFCNASWSYSIVSTLSDRLSKWSHGQDVGALSYQQHRNCVKGQRQRSHPCNSGYLTKSWKYVMNTGLVKESCYPESPNSRCELYTRRLASKTMANCPIGGEGKLTKASAMSRVGGETAIMKEIADAGPVVATIRVFPDLFVYQEGIYTCPASNPKYGRLHSVKLIGWGEQIVNGQIVPYWIAANSWGLDWGEDGFFRIKRGTNECDIEEFVLSFYINSKRSRRSINGKLSDDPLEDEDSIEQDELSDEDEDEDENEE